MLQTVVHRCALLLLGLSFLPHIIALTPLRTTHASHERKQRTNGEHTKGVLIFLDDCERGFFEAISFDLLTALVSEAGPIITSASLLANMKRTAFPEEKDPKKLLATFNTLIQKEPTDEEGAIEKNIILSITSLDEEMADRWVIKQVNMFLYLLIPKKFLHAQQLSVADVTAYTPTRPITHTEQVLGLQVNHMRTITTIADISTPKEEPEYAGYFIDALPALFVTNNHYKKDVPAWALYIVGHATINALVAGLSITQFKDFLTFLATKITTELLLYSSCYTIGVTSEAIFGDAEREIQNIYPFTIITQSLTEAMTYSALPKLRLAQGKLKIDIPSMYIDFFASIASPKSINYRDLLAPFAPHFTSLASMPQIRRAGSAHFSVLEDDRIIPITSAMTQSRTQPLDTAAYAVQHNHGEEPLALLLYTETVPFELRITSKTMPACVSMVPGSAVHRIKKIASHMHTAATILKSFSAIYGLPPRKIYIIDELTAPVSETHKESATAYHVIIDTTKTVTTQMYTDATGAIYSVSDTGPVLAGADAQKKYHHLLALHGIKKQAPQHTHSIQELLDTFKQHVTAQKAEQRIKDLLDFMPENTAIRIPTIISAPTESCDAWCQMLFNLEYHTCPLGTHKLVWINGITYAGHELYKDIIIDKIDKGWFRVLFTSSCHHCPVSLHRGIWDDLPEQYVPMYTKLFDTMTHHKKYDKELTCAIEMLEKKAVHKLITFWYIEKVKTTHKVRYTKQHPW